MFSILDVDQDVADWCFGLIMKEYASPYDGRCTPKESCDSTLGIVLVVATLNACAATAANQILRIHQWSLTDAALVRGKEMAEVMQGKLDIHG